jgi:hypothetical protein
VSAIGLDIVSTFRKMSTKPDQVHGGATAIACGYATPINLTSTTNHWSLKRFSR